MANQTVSELSEEQIDGRRKLQEKETQLKKASEKKFTESVSPFHSSWGKPGAYAKHVEEKHARNKKINLWYRKECDKVDAVYDKAIKSLKKVGSKELADKQKQAIKKTTKKAPVKKTTKKAPVKRKPAAKRKPTAKCKIVRVKTHTRKCPKQKKERNGKKK